MSMTSVCLSVCPSVTLVNRDKRWNKKWKSAYAEDDRIVLSCYLEFYLGRPVWVWKMWGVCTSAAIIKGSYNALFQCRICWAPCLLNRLLQSQKQNAT